MPEPLQPVLYADPQTPNSEASHGEMSRLSFEDTLATLKVAIETEGLWLLHEIDPQMLLKRGGFQIHPARQLLFFHPRYVVRIMEINPSALIEAPLKIAVLELPDGSVLLRHQDVAAGFERYPGLAALGTELAELCERVVATVLV